MHHIQKLLIFLLLTSPAIGSADRIELNLAVRDNFNYISELLTHSLELQGHHVTINGLSGLPHERVMIMLSTGDELSLHWRGQSPKWDRKFATVEVDLTNGLKGYRVFLIPKGKQAEYDSIGTLDEFRQLGKVGIFGSGWSDIAIWQHNGLRTHELGGNWDPGIYKMLSAGNRGVDYFSRGIIEIPSEIKKHPYLDVENKLVFIYPKDFRFYLPEHNKHLKPILQKALVEYISSGNLDKLIRKHFPEIFRSDGLNLEGRRKIFLEMPIE